MSIFETLGRGAGYISHYGGKAIKGAGHIAKEAGKRAIESYAEKQEIKRMKRLEEYERLKKRAERRRMRRR